MTAFSWQGILAQKWRQMALDGTGQNPESRMQFFLLTIKMNVLIGSIICENKYKIVIGRYQVLNSH